MMSTNSLAIFQKLFLKNPKNIKDIFTHVSSFVEDKDKAIAEFLAVEYPELIWLICVLHVEYEKQFLSDTSSSQHVVEKIARSITLTVDETGILDYGQKDHNNLIYNTLETYLLKSHHHTNHRTQESEDIISLDSSAPDMDLVYQHTTTFEDIALHNYNVQTNHTEVSSKTSDNILSHQNKQLPTYTQDASVLNAINKHNQDASVIQHLQHITTNYANDVVNVAQIVDQVVTSRGAQQTLSDSIHAPQGPSVVNLSLTDLRHRLNALRHKSISERPGLLSIPAASVPGYNRLDKLQHIQSIFQLLPGYLDHNWMYHDRSATIMVEFSNIDYTRQAQQEASVSHLALEITPIITLDNCYIDPNLLPSTNKGIMCRIRNLLSVLSLIPNHNLNTTTYLTLIDSDMFLYPSATCKYNPTFHTTITLKVFRK